MAAIKDIIFTEFLVNGYEIIVESGAITVFKNREFEDFWVVCPDGFTLRKQRDLYEATVKPIAEQAPYVLKNTSLLVLSDFDKELLTTEQLVEMEKDPYFFKKYILQYSDELAHQLLELRESKSAKSISDLIMLPESFNALNEENGYGKYHLLYSIAHKLPFIPIQAEQKGIKPRDFMFGSPQEWDALEEVMSIDGDVQIVYDSLKAIVEKEVDEQH